MHHRFLAIEHYASIVIARWESFTGETAEKLE
jgi:hypothetical protein